MPAIKLTEDILEDAITLGDELIEAGAKEEAVAKSIAKFLDSLVPLNVLIPGPAGVVAEAVDGPVIERVVSELMKAFRASPEKKAKRKARRAKRKAKRAAK